MHTLKLLVSSTRRRLPTVLATARPEGIPDALIFDLLCSSSFVYVPKLDQLTAQHPAAGRTSMLRLPAVGESRPKAWEMVNDTQKTTRERVILNETSSSTTHGKDGIITERPW